MVSYDTTGKALDPRDDILEDEGLYKGKPPLKNGNSGTNKLFIFSIIILAVIYSKRKKK